MGLAVALVAAALAGCSGPLGAPGAEEDGGPPPEVQVDGGLLLGAADGLIRVRALGAAATCTLEWPAGSGRRTWQVQFANVIAPERALLTVDGREAPSVGVRPVGPERPTAGPADTVDPAEPNPRPSPIVAVDVTPRPGQQTVVGLVTPAPPAPWRFAVIGDTQGRNESLARAAELIAAADAEFIVHLGDMTSAGAAAGYRAFEAAVGRAGLAYLTVPGNHDVRGDGLATYERELAPRDYAVEVAGWRLVFVDTSSLEVDEAQLAAIDLDLGNYADQPTLVFTHVPPFDPRALAGEDPHTLMAGADELLDLLQRHPQVAAVFCGHIHMFYHREALEAGGGPQLVISGGGGARLYAGEDQGGFHHFVMVTVGADGGIGVEPVPFAPADPPDGLVVRGPDGTAELTFDQLKAMEAAEADSSFENQFGNVRGAGRYRGVAVADLLALVGGMRRGDRLRVHASDGFEQTYEFVNVYPPAEGPYARQGQMVLAHGYAAVGEALAAVPEWEDGPRLVFLPEDGLYSNEDCRLSSPPGTGWHEYQSAGARWPRNVALLEVVR